MNIAEISIDVNLQSIKFSEYF